MENKTWWDKYGGVTTPIISTVGGGILGGLKALFQRRKNRQKKLNRAIQTIYSPFTNLGVPVEKQETSPFESIIKGAIGGLGLGQSISSALEKRRLAEELLGANKLNEAIKEKATLTMPRLGEGTLTSSPFSQSLGNYSF